jgi:hypothetical protein
VHQGSNPGLLPECSYFSEGDSDVAISRKGTQGDRFLGAATGNVLFCLFAQAENGIAVGGEANGFLNLRNGFGYVHVYICSNGQNLDAIQGELRIKPMFRDLDFVSSSKTAFFAPLREIFLSCHFLRRRFLRCVDFGCRIRLLLQTDHVGHVDQADRLALLVDDRQLAELPLGE